MRWSRIGLAIAAVLFALGVGVGGALAWMFATEPGTAWLVERLQSRIPSLAAIDEVAGTLSRGLALRGIAVTAPAYRVQVDSIDLELDLSELLGRKLGIDRIAIGIVRYETIAQSIDAEREPLSLPLEIVVDGGSIQSLVVVRDGEETRVGPAQFAATIQDQRIAFDRLDGTAFGVELSGAGEVVLGREIGIDVVFDWAFSRNEIDYAGRGTARGQWPQLTVHQDIAAPAAVVADGEVVFAAQPNATVDLSWSALRWPWAPQVRSEAGTGR